MLNELRNINIPKLDEQAMQACRARLDVLTKPLNSLAAFEDIAVRLAGITRNERPRDLRKGIVVMVADHGVAMEGVSAYPQEVTKQMLYNFCNGGAAINVLARHAGADLLPVNVGLAGDIDKLPGLISARVAAGTANMAVGAAMTKQEMWAAINVGMETVAELKKRNIEIVGVGELGIGNTTASTAILACYSNLELTELTGRGTGLSEAGLRNKQSIIRQSLAINAPDTADPLDVLLKVGGLEIAAMVGLILASANARMALVVDGLISSVAALIAYKINPAVRQYLFGSHLSAEPGHTEVLRLLDLPVYLHLDMRLGEGSGAAMGISLMDAALHVLNDMKTFAEAQVSIAQDGPGMLRQKK